MDQAEHRRYQRAFIQYLDEYLVDGCSFSVLINLLFGEMEQAFRAGWAAGGGVPTMDGQHELDLIDWYDRCADRVVAKLFFKKLRESAQEEKED